MKSIIHIVTNKDLILYTKKIRLSELWSTPLTVVTKQYTWSGGQIIRHKAVHILSILRSVCPPHPVKQNWQNGRGAPPGRIPAKLSILGIASVFHQSPGFTPHSKVFLHSNIIAIDFSKPALLGFPPTCDSTLEPGFYRGFSHFFYQLFLSQIILRNFHSLL